MQSQCTSPWIGNSCTFCRIQDALETLVQHYGSLETLDFDVLMLW